MFRLLFRLSVLIFTLLVNAMAASFGRQPTYTTGTLLQVLAGPNAKADWKLGGVTLDWTTVVAASGDQTLGDGTVVKSGQKGLQYGTILAKITATGLYGIYDSAASDGRQLLVRGDTYIMNESLLQTPVIGLGSATVNHPGVFDGGRVFIDRIQVVTGAALQPSQVTTTRPTLANFEALFPRIQWARAT